MRIAGWRMDGFGLFADYSVEDLPSGLTVIYGPNEAGKSTTLAFIRGMLFGFPDGRSSARRYPPLRGGQAGGKLWIDAEDALGADAGRWIVERTILPSRLTVTLPGGSSGSQSDLERLLGHADKSLFHSIFAFTLEELSSLGALDAQEVSERVFATPVMGAGRSPSEAIRTLEQRRDNLLRKRSTSAEINAAMQSLEDVHKQIREARNIAEEYPKAVQERENAQKEIARLTEELEQARKDASRYQTLIDLWPDWSERSSALEELGRLEIPDGVSREMYDRLQDVKDRIEKANEKLADQRERLRGHEARLARVILDDRLSGMAAEVKSSFEGMSAYLSERDRLAVVERDVETSEADVGDALATLGPAWDRLRVTSLDVSIPTAEEVRTWGDRLRQADDNVRRSEDAIADHSKRRGEIVEELEELDAELKKYQGAPDFAALENANSLIVRLRATLAELNGAETRVESAAQAAQAVRDRRSFRRILYGVAAILVVIAAGMGVARQPVAAIVVATVAIAALLAAVWTGAKGGLEEAEALHEQRKQELEDHKRQIKGLASSLGLQPAPSFPEVEELASVVAKHRESRAEADKLSRQLDSKRALYRDMDDKMRDAEAEFTAAQVTAENTGAEWNRWRVALGVPEPMSPEAVTALFTSIQRARESLRHLDGMEKERQELREKIDGFEKSAHRILDIVGMDPAARGSALVAAITTLHEKVLDDEKARESKGSLEIDIEGARKGISEAEAAVLGSESALNALLAEAGADDENELREFISRSRSRDQLLETEGAAAKRINARLGKGQEAEHLRAKLATGEVTTWESLRARVADEVARLEGERDEAVRNDQEAKRKESDIANSSDAASLEIEAEGLRQQLTDAIDRWQTATLAKSLIEETLSRFRDKHQPKVIKRASELFRTITGEHYENLVALAQDKSFEVFTRESKHVRVEDLSTGTAQQLYLCIRFGLAEEFARRGASLPLIMDEVLVNFDPERARAVANVIADVSIRHQVLVFTCHPETVDMVSDACKNAMCGNARVIELERFRGGVPVPDPQRLSAQPLGIVQT